jgi:quinol monooxygenase YgiN
MYARLVIFKVGPGERSTIEGLVNEFDALYRAQKGFRHVFILGDEASGEYGSFSVWESKEDADAANAVIAPQLQQALTGLLQSPPERWLFEVLEAERNDT